MNDELISDLTKTMAEHDFRKVGNISAIPDAELVLKRQTWNTNRAVVLVSPDRVPIDFGDYLRQLRRRVAFRCGFFPFFWGIGIQVIVVASDLAESGIHPIRHVAKVDNQWAIVQSIFLVDPGTQTYCSARTWGQFVTGKFQDALAVVLSRHFESIKDERFV